MQPLPKAWGASLGVQRLQTSMSASADLPKLPHRPWLGGSLVVLGALVLLGDWLAADWLLNLVGVLGGAAIVAGGYLWQRGQGSPAPTRTTALALSPAAIERELQKAEVLVEKLDGDVSLRAQAEAIRADLERAELRIAVVGPVGAGKSSLVAALTGLPALAALQLSWLDQEPLGNPDLLLFVTAGDLSASEYARLRELNQPGRPTLLILNQSDRYLPPEREQLLARLRELGQALPDVRAVLSVAAAPGPLKVRQHYADGSVREWFEAAQPEVQALEACLLPLLSREGEVLKLANALLQAQTLTASAQATLNQLRRRRAQPVVERYQWLTAAAVFANPLAGLDLLATAAINAQMLRELAEVYECELGLQQARPIARTLAVLILKLGLVELSTQGIGVLLKSNVATYAVGGVVQGVSAAYLTHLGALAFMACLEQEQGWSKRSLGQALREIFQQNQRTAFLQTFAKQGVARLLGEPKPAQLESA